MVSDPIDRAAMIASGARRPEYRVVNDATGHPSFPLEVAVS